jgi:hypothetical protein
MTLPLVSIMESKHKSKSDNEAKKSCKVMTPDEKIKILDNVAWWYECSSSWPNILLIFYFTVLTIH